MEFFTGRIIKGVGGLYVIATETAEYNCSARGIFRNRDITPLIGDFVEITVDTNVGTKEQGRIEKILERKNSLARPPVANIDILFIIVAASHPEPNIFLVDKLTAVAEVKGIEPVIVINKSDEGEQADFINIYKDAGFKVIVCSAVNGDGIEDIAKLVKGKTVTFVGVSGVGKSSILNALAPDMTADVSHLSEKIGRGRHTTRHSELFSICGGYVADTPGFSNMEIEQYEVIRTNELPSAFREFEPYADKCKFRDCSHTKEQGCAVLQAVKDGLVSQSRHNSYLVMFEQSKNIKEWEL